MICSFFCGGLYLTVGLIRVSCVVYMLLEGPPSQCVLCSSDWLQFLLTQLPSGYVLSSFKQLIPENQPATFSQVYNTLNISSSVCAVNSKTLLCIAFVHIG